MTIGLILCAIIAAMVDVGIHKNWFYKWHKPAKYALGTLNFWALGDRLLIEEDEFKSGFECETCGGSGRLKCASCDGSGASRVVKDAKCVPCGGNGKRICPECGGKGGLIITPDIAQRRPTTGTIVSAGHKCHLSVGSKVMFSNFAGYVVDLARAGGGNTTLRILHESEILVGMDGSLTLANLKGKSEIATFQN